MRKRGIWKERNVEMLECWKDKVLGKWRNHCVFRRVIPSFHYSIIPVLSLFLISGCGGGKDSDAAKIKPMALVQVATAVQRDLHKKLTYTGSVEPVKLARMASPAEGPVVECTVREGDKVTKGQVLVRVGRSRIAETGLAAAREELRRQEAEFKRTDQLVKSGALPGDQLDDARANLKRAEAQVAAMETGADDYAVEAPWDGVVSRLWIAEGNYVSPRTPLVELYDPASLVVRLSVPEQQSLAVAAGQSVEIALDAHPGQHYKGKIVRVYPELERTTRTLTAEAVIEDDIRLLSGMFARVDITVQTLAGAVVIPQGALVVLPNGETVVFAVDGEKASLRKVQIAMEAGGFIAVKSGIQGGEMVIIRGNDALKDGTQVQVKGQKKSSGVSDGAAGMPIPGKIEKPAGKDLPAS